MESRKENAPDTISQGIETLIDKLKQNGVNAGKEEAEKIINAAQEKANKMLNDAQLKVKALMEEEHQYILKEKKAAEDALLLAARNMRIELRQKLIDRFSLEVKRLVHKELDNENTLRELIILLGINTVEQLNAFKAKNIEIQLPEKALDFDEIRKNPDLMDGDSLKTLVQCITNKMLQEGMQVRINSSNTHMTGLKIHLIDEDIVLDLSEEAVSQLLIKHMQPRFRALLEGLLQ
ncbi:hypothetical protein [Legionella bononiensis]|uniref:V-type ATP synthase subunit E n=1 Tax=Legionella bononiensis TaxID=2793102 RepID=A0ABS1W744_9GAMM|nr:hypothetical protein [Legionella bononiensis]MBL7478433.1 hypothetical protein [Legionella bononiensis]MBL7525030.1 hypothetical protein [Legionella bononiensis]MBL7561327.1 hypothetical protein [Legionella bononiensis]